MPSLPLPRPAYTLLPFALLLGCARPGPPRAPSLHIPAVVTDLSAARTGDTVELRFTAPTRASDTVPLPAGPLRGVLCRQLGPATPGTCISVTGISLTIVAKAAPQAVVLEDNLPAALTTGTPSLLSYRVQFFNAKGTSIGESEPAYALAGAAPAPVAGLTATGARNGIVLTWTPVASTDEVLLERTDLAPTPTRQPRPTASPDAKPRTIATPRHTARHAIATPERTASAANVTWLQANAEPATARTLDTAIDPETPYQYRALRRRIVKLGGRTLELRSALSPPQQITLQQVYAPAAPTGLNVAAYFDRSSATPGFAVDLIWQPVDDDTRTAPLAGYNIYRETLDAQNNVIAPSARLNATPAPLPSFHDATAKPTERYRYRVTAIDTKANESPAATAILDQTVDSRQ
jgi:hypothetical protein